LYSTILFPDGILPPQTGGDGTEKDSMSILSTLAGLNVNNQNTTNAAERATRIDTTAAGKTADTKASSATVSSDSVSLSSASAAVSALQGDSDVRFDKVAALQKSIGDGSYSVSSSDLADSLVDSLLGNKA
jgi:flagellar biosynthesis anti-sigma factor FlgM